MNEQAEGVTASPTLEQKALLEPVEVSILGDIDPRTLSREAFENSHGILFHGAAKPFNYSPKYDYSSAEYFTDTDGSQTLGEGLYATDARDAAENYSRVRQGKDNAEPIVLVLLPYQARMLDLRGPTDNSKNAPVPKELFEKWFQFYKNYYFNNENRKNLPWYIQGSESGYWTLLNEARKLDKVMDLRTMLDTGGIIDPALRELHHNLPSPPWTRLFSNFMKQEGYDGLVYNEGGEGKNPKASPSYIFYNLEKIGTYDSWHSGRNST